MTKPQEPIQLELPFKQQYFTDGGTDIGTARYKEALKESLKWHEEQAQKSLNRIAEIHKELSRL